MTISPLIVYLGASTVVGIATRLWVVGRRDLRARRAYSSRLFGESVLTDTLAPTPGECDDEDVLAELAETLSHLNRQTYAAEMWGLDEQLALYYWKIPASSRPTMQRALGRMLSSGDRWLTALAAATAARIPLPALASEVEAVLALSVTASAQSPTAVKYASALEAAAIRLRKSTEAQP